MFPSAVRVKLMRKQMIACSLPVIPVTYITGDILSFVIVALTLVVLALCVVQRYSPEADPELLKLAQMSDSNILLSLALDTQEEDFDQAA